MTLVSDLPYPFALLGSLIFYLKPHGPPLELQSNKKTNKDIQIWLKLFLMDKERNSPLKIFK